jgi:hypothetical protein
MRLHLAFALSALMALVAVPVAAQTHSSSVGLNAGAVIYSSFNSGAGSPASDLKPSPGLVGNVQYDWFVGAGNLGFRAAGHYQRMELDWSTGTREIFAYAGDFDLLLRPIRPDTDTKVIPYLSVGVGFTRYRLGNGNPSGYEPADALYLGNEKTQFSLLAGIGLDFVTGWHWDEGNFLIRLEAQDNYVTESPFAPASGGGEFNGIHNLRITLGIHNTMGTLLR